MGYLYKVQVGAYSSKANATRMKMAVEAAVKKRIKSGKLKENISAAILKDGGLWKVQCGAFSSEANAKKRLQQIHEAGFPNAKIMKVGTAASSGSSGKTTVVTSTGRIRIAALAFFDTGNETTQYGDCTALIQYGKDDKTVEHAPPYSAHDDFAYPACQKASERSAHGDLRRLDESDFRDLLGRGHDLYCFVNDDGPKDFLSKTGLKWLNKLGISCFPVFSGKRRDM